MKNIEKLKKKLILRPAINNPKNWFPKRPSQTEWKILRSLILERDDNTCVFCGHQAFSFMNIHHLDVNSKPSNLVTCCVACHHVLHMGRSLSMNIIGVYKSEYTQKEIIQKTRQGVRNRVPLHIIRQGLKLENGEYHPMDLNWANDLLLKIKNKPIIQLQEPYVVAFHKYVRWQYNQ